MKYLYTIFFFYWITSGSLFSQDTVYFKNDTLIPKAYKNIRFDGKHYFLEVMSNNFWEEKVNPDKIHKIIYQIDTNQINNVEFNKVTTDSATKKVSFTKVIEAKGISKKTLYSLTKT
jgi:hypothetical protein